MCARSGLSAGRRVPRAPVLVRPPEDIHTPTRGGGGGSGGGGGGGGGDGGTRTAAVRDMRIAIGVIDQMLQEGMISHDQYDAKKVWILSDFN